ncbi:DUF2007 domain-containing protein [Comamonas sp.]|uniref:putative signal transducing protein n=1 Tax=Comamonas sp. TaxID=34028 RepID=UPI002897FA27|nr:DUF2007 domain-containing protein [Comamonas sp.]
MRSVYEPANAVQAHVLQDVLRQHGIASFVSGEHLQGAIGELPAGSLLRLWVDEADWSAARRALEEWERAPLIDDAELARADPSLGEQPPSAPAHDGRLDSRFDLACDPGVRAASQRDGEQEAYSDARRWYPAGGPVARRCWRCVCTTCSAACLRRIPRAMRVLQSRPGRPPIPHPPTVNAGKQHPQAADERQLMRCASSGLFRPPLTLKSIKYRYPSGIKT